MATANIRAVITAEDRASAALAGFGNKVGGVGKKIASAMKIATVAAGAATAALITFSLNQFRDIQKNVAGIQALTKNTAEAKRVLKDAIDFVQGKPFDRLDTIGAAKQLLAFGRTANQIKGDLKTLGNTVLISGIDWTNLTRVYGRVVSSGKLLREDFNILNDAGVGLAKTLQDELGTNMQGVFEKMEDGEISAEIFQRALKKAAPDSATENALNTFDNKLLSLKAKFRDIGFAILGVDFNEISEGGEPLVKPGGLLDRLTDGMDAVTASFKKLDFGEISKRFADFAVTAIETAQSIASHLSPKVKALFNSFKELVPELAKLVTKLGPVLVGALGLAIDSINALVKGLTPLVKWLNKNEAAAQGLAVALSTLFIATKVNAGLIAMTGILGKLSKVFGATTASAASASVATAKVGKVAMAARVLLNPYVLGLAAVAGGAFFVSKKINEWKESQDKIQGQLEKAPRSLTHFSDSISTTSDTISGLNTKLRSTSTGMTLLELATKGSGAADRDAGLVKQKYQAILKQQPQIQKEVQSATKLVEDAQLRYNEAVRKYGPQSIQAQSASLKLGNAQDILKQKMGQAAQSAFNARDAKIKLGLASDYAKQKANQLKNMQKLLKEGIDRTVTTVAKFGPVANAQVGPVIKLSNKLRGIANLKGSLQGINGVLGGISGNIVQVAGQAKNLQNTVGGIRLQGAGGRNLQGGSGRLQGNATGTDFFGGGRSLVGERGPEIVELPRGSRVRPNDKTEKVMRNNQPTVNFNVNIGMYAGTEMEKRRIAESLFRAYSDLVRANPSKAVI